MTLRTTNERGAAMVLVLGALVVLAILALVAMNITLSEKKTESVDYVNNRSFYSADAASEAGVAWIRRQAHPPSLVDTLGHVSVSAAYTTLADEDRYKFDVKFVRKRFRPGWGVEYKDYEYVVEARGVSAREAESAIELGATKPFKEGY